ncbi:hypothetical protein J2T15_003915 [Paenibacillus harenae]|uniref:Uncharacterized protein n=1 Tax=Paenibacillus harenae TaxID=306543 RepID=A0ABT9U6Z1_PAEHA|nr:hypothetical protein [Paenibacillus harenae]
MFLPVTMLTNSYAQLNNKAGCADSVSRLFF